jgi:DNA-directed RNA polymerase specialized sigma24 family protein
MSEGELSLPGARPKEPATDWGEIREACQAADPSSQNALGNLIERYRSLILSRLASRFHFPADEVEDLLHSFIESKILRGELLKRADPKRGSFRAFLRNAVDNFAISEIRRRRAHKRSPGAEMVNLDDVPLAELPAESGNSDGSSDLVWAQAVVAGALLDMRNELVHTDRLHIWEVFEGRVLRTLLDGAAPLDYSSIIERFNFSSPSQALNVLVTAKRMFRRHLRAVIANYTQDDSQVEEELARLHWILDR